MKLTTSTFILTLCFNLSFAQYQYFDFLVDSVHYEVFEEGDDINGELIEVAIMQNFTSKERNVKYYYVNNQDRVLNIETFEIINDNDELTKKEINYLETELDLDNIYSYEYNGQTLLKERKQSFNVDDEFDSEKNFENFDTFGNYTLVKQIQSRNEEEFILINQDSLIHEYQNGNLVNTLFKKLNLTTGEYKDYRSRNFVYNSEGQLIDEEQFDGLSSTLRFTHKQQYSYLDNGKVESILYYYSDLSTENDQLDYIPSVKEKFIYDDFGEISEIRYYKIISEQDSYLSDVYYLFRKGSVTTSTKEIDRQVESITINNLDFNYISINIKGLKTKDHYEVQLYDKVGAQIFKTHTEQIETWEKELRLPTGTYFLQLISKSGAKQIKKILIF